MEHVIVIDGIELLADQTWGTNLAREGIARSGIWHHTEGRFGPRFTFEPRRSQCVFYCVLAINLGEAC